MSRLQETPEVAHRGPTGASSQACQSSSLLKRDLKIISCTSSPSAAGLEFHLDAQASSGPPAIPGRRLAASDGLAHLKFLRGRPDPVSSAPGPRPLRSRPGCAASAPMEYPLQWCRRSGASAQPLLLPSLLRLSRGDPYSWLWFAGLVGCGSRSWSAGFLCLVSRSCFALDRDTGTRSIRWDLAWPRFSGPDSRDVISAVRSP